jgi:hypothetical protein
MANLLTNCTARKRASPLEGLTASSLGESKAATLGIADLVDEWIARINQHRQKPQNSEARHLYAGGAFSHALEAHNAAGGMLFVASAGLGLLNGSEKVPAYGLSITGNSTENILNLIPEARADQWWKILCQKTPYEKPLDSVFEANSETCTIFSLSRPYLSMLSNDIFGLPRNLKSRVRIVTRSPVHAIDERIREYVMPYDECIDADPFDISLGRTIPGTRGDAAQRAAAHFARNVLKNAPLGDLKSHKECVADLIKDWRKPLILRREQKTDDEIKACLSALWDQYVTSPSRLLRVLRDEKNIACEQGRFSRLIADLKRDRGYKNG